MQASQHIHKILLIDDEEDIVRVLSMSLRSDGYEVLPALSGEEGLRLFEAHAPDLVLTDIKMPGMDGIEVLQKIKAAGAETEVIIITGHGDIDNAIEALKFGASDFINKPVRDEVLAVSIQRADEKLAIRQKLKAYTDNLEEKVAQATLELRRKSNFLSRLIESSNDAIIATDENLDIVIFNPGAERIFGYAFNEVNTTSIKHLLTDELFRRLPTRANSGAAQPPNQWREAIVTAKDGSTIPVRWYAAPLREGAKLMGTVSFYQDLREIKRLEKELLHAERLAAIGQTVAGVAHGVKNLLHGFKGGSYLVNLGIEKNNREKLDKGWDMIQRNIGRTSDLVMDLLSFSREREPEYTACDPNAIVTEVCQMVQTTADQYHIRIVKDLAPAVGTIHLDEHILHQCLSNLISNAIDACLFEVETEKQWQVTVRTRLVESSDICFDVIDNGMGMEREVRDKLFSRFFSTKGHRGTGLGLLVTRKLVQEHGGTISVESEPGEGTTFTICLPFATRNAHAVNS
jgi:PAS domain S-box-containing protein